MWAGIFIFVEQDCMREQNVGRRLKSVESHWSRLPCVTFKWAVLSVMHVCVRASVLACVHLFPLGLWNNPLVLHVTLVAQQHPLYIFVRVLKVTPRGR